ncbi:MAG TPA: Type 1 glutamine amidotransferase-like domain-containing protein [Nocardioidaceae bacterium]|nr:Type 1 glutamine amidotransferase-like domain-containing protein [Nocardioidaceae bacterium]
MTVFLVGGGPESVTTPGLLDPFVAEMRSKADQHGRTPRMAVVLVDGGGSGERFLPAYVEALGAGRSIETVLVFLGRDGTLDPAAFAYVDGIVVGGGPAPAYLEGLAPAFDNLRSKIASGTPYLGFSAGAMVAAQAALVGGHRVEDREVCPEDWSEGLAPVTLRPGLGLVGFTVDVHTAQAGTLGRTVAAVETGAASAAVGIDEGTCVAVDHTGAAEACDLHVSGSGSAWLVRTSETPGSVVVTHARGRVRGPSL